MHPTPATNLLVVEDSEDDLFFFRRLIGKAGINLPVAVATDGQLAIDYLQRAIAATELIHPPVPSVVFLDLKLPLRSGLDVLEWMRTQKQLNRTAAVILSSSDEYRDVARAFALGAQGYLVKFPDPADFTTLLERVAACPPETDLMKLNLPGLRRPS